MPRKHEGRHELGFSALVKPGYLSAGSKDRSRQLVPAATDVGSVLVLQVQWEILCQKTNGRETGKNTKMTRGLKTHKNICAH